MDDRELGVTCVEDSLGDAGDEPSRRGARGAVMAKLVAPLDFFALLPKEY
jgi:hypothetical protein